MEQHLSKHVVAAGHIYIFLPNSGGRRRGPQNYPLPFYFFSSSFPFLSRGNRENPGMGCTSRGYVLVTLKYMQAIMLIPPGNLVRVEEEGKLSRGGQMGCCAVPYCVHSKY